VIAGFPGLVRGLFAGRRVGEVKIGFGGISVKLAANEIARANEVWNLAGPDAAEIQARLAALVRIPHVMWVDDRPADTAHERRALQFIGYDVVVVGSNDAAARHFARRRVDVVVSDIRRKAEGEDAGLHLPERLAKVRKPTPPVIYYLGQVDAPMTPQGYPVTDTPLELFRLIGEALETGKTPVRG
jgi:CheY-like chemotaxis protein